MTDAIEIAFFVPGVPVPGGSKKAFVNKKTGRAIITDVSGQRVIDWRASVQNAAANVFDGALLDGPIYLEITFVMPRPKRHFRTGKNAHLLREDAPYYHTSAPDRTKLTRSTEDALTGVIWTDDSRAADGPIRKIYGSKPGAHITIREL